MRLTRLSRILGYFFWLWAAAVAGVCQAPRDDLRVHGSIFVAGVLPGVSILLYNIFCLLFYYIISLYRIHCVVFFSDKGTLVSSWPGVTPALPERVGRVWAYVHVIDTMVCTGCCATLDNIITYLFKKLTRKQSKPASVESDTFLRLLELHPDILQQVRHCAWQ